METKKEELQALLEQNHNNLTETGIKRIEMLEQELDAPNKKSS